MTNKFGQKTENSSSLDKILPYKLILVVCGPVEGDTVFKFVSV